MSRKADEIAYQLRVAAEEIDAMRGEIRLGNLPHIKALLQRPGMRWVLTRVQELIWTFEHLTRRRIESRAGSQPTLSAESTDPATDIWFDVTNSYRSGFKGGVARVAMKLAESASRSRRAQPVVMRDGEFWAYPDVDRGGAPLRVGAETIFVIIDTFWKPFEEYVRATERIRLAGGRSVICVHDIIALDYPVFFDVAFARDFRSRLAILLQQTDACVTVSDYTRSQVRENFPERSALPMDSFRLGADFEASPDGSTKSLRASVRKALDGRRVFVSVGTLEPRKGYAVSLDAFDTLWKDNIECTLVIFGQQGWVCNALEKRILEHPSYGSRLFWIADASDAELQFAYSAAYCLIQASIVEGFGLPIVEACRARTPVIASDAEIFREVGQGKLTYFRNCDSADLARVLKEALRARPVGEGLDVATWDQSLDELTATVRRLLPPRNPSAS